MADEINKKISIEVDIVKNGQQQLNQYKAAFDSLRSSVNNISSPLASLDKNISKLNDSIAKLNIQNKSVNDSGNKLKTSLKELSETYDSLEKIMGKGNGVLTEFKESFASFEATATMGLSLLISYGPELWDWITSLIKSKDVLQESALSLGILNDALQSSDYSNSIEQVTQLRISFDLFHQGMLNKKEVLEQYNDTLGKTLGTTDDINVAEDQLTKHADDYIKMTLLKAQAQIALHDAAQNAIEIEQEKNKKEDELLSTWDKIVTGFETTVMLQGDARKEKAEENRKEALADLNNEKDLYTKIAKDFEAQAAKISAAFTPTPAKSGNGNSNNDKLQQQKKALQNAETIYTESLKRQSQITTEAYANEIATENAHYQDQLTKLKKSLDDKLISKQEYAKVNQQLENEHNANIAAITDKYNQQDAQRVLQAQNELSELQIKGMKSGFAKQIAELTQQQKEREEQYDKTDKESATRIERLNNEMSAAKNANPNADTTQLQKMIDAEWSIIDLNNKKRIEYEKLTDAAIHDLKKQAYLQNDEDALNKADNSDAKYEAQRKLIIDSANFEIEQNKDNADKVKNIRIGLMGDLLKLDTDHQTGKNNEEEAKQKQIRKQRIEEAKKVAQQIGADGLKAVQDSIKQQADAKVAALEKDKAAELNNTALTSTQKAAIQQKYQQEEGKIKAKAFKEEQEINIAQAIMNGALAVTKVTAQDGVLAALEIGAIVAETAAQVAKIASQKPPAYAAGGLHYASDGRGGLLPGYSRTDNTNAFLRSGEGIVVSEAMREPWARNLVSAINVGFGGRDFSTTATGRGFAVGGIFTDGGNANRYYNQPVNDNKNLANTIAYQMINNFPPVYVDVKDINNQQNILAQTINRVNL